MPEGLEEVPFWPWKLTFAIKVADKEHINLKELRALRAYVRRRAKGGYTTPQRILVLIDSQVARGAIARGRSPSLPINQALRSILPYVAGSDIQLSVLWVPSALNPSDAPSRAQPLWQWLADWEKKCGAGARPLPQ